MPIEQDAHVEDRVDGDAGHAHVADDARMIAVVAAMGGQIERDRQAHLAGGEVAAIERVGVFGRREAGVLAHGPRLAHVHRRVRPAHERRKARQRAQMIDAGQIGSRIQRPMRDAFGRVPTVGRVRGRRGGGRLIATVEVEIEARVIGQRHDCAPNSSDSVLTTSQPTKMKPSTPASRSAASSAPGRPAMSTRLQPAALSARARSAASTA